MNYAKNQNKIHMIFNKEIYRKGTWNFILHNLKKKKYILGETRRWNFLQWERQGKALKKAFGLESLHSERGRGEKRELKTRRRVKIQLCLQLRIKPP